jgi:hypothetical protein
MTAVLMLQAASLAVTALGLLQHMPPPGGVGWAAGHQSKAAHVQGGAWLRYRWLWPGHHLLVQP